MKINFPKKKTNLEIEKFFFRKKLSFLVAESKKKKKKTTVNQKLLDKDPYQPVLSDLYNLYQLIILNKRTTILEFGTGWSSIIFYLALNDLKKLHSNKIKELRRNNPFELFILDNEKKYFNISKKRIIELGKKIKIKNPPKVHYFFSDVEMTLFESKIATQYKKLPLCNPDFIYLDGPNLFNVKGEINGINTAHLDMMPMVCDILKFEYFFQPGTIIISDGRAANVKFLKDHFKRNWKYSHDQKNDQHSFLLDDPLLGKFNKLQIEFYNSKS